MDMCASQCGIFKDMVIPEIAIAIIRDLLQQELMKVPDKAVDLSGMTGSNLRQIKKMWGVAILP